MTSTPSLYQRGWGRWGREAIENREALKLARREVLRGEHTIGFLTKELCLFRGSGGRSTREEKSGRQKPHLGVYPPDYRNRRARKIRTDNPDLKSSTLRSRAAKRRIGRKALSRALPTNQLESEPVGEEWVGRTEGRERREGLAPARADGWFAT